MTPQDYDYLYSSAILTGDSSRLRALDFICRTALANQQQYRFVAVKTGIPWLCIAAIHYRESSQSFTRHLHNGDPLTARTVHVPIGRPEIGTPPFTWVQSATDALAGFYWRPASWSLPSVLEFCERYNGLAYHKTEVNSPYLWSYTDKYTSGLFVADGVLDPAKQDAEAGCAAIFKRLERMGTALDFLS
jgi:lysozyme family protein